MLGLGFLALRHPLVAFGVCVVLLVTIAVFAAAIVRAVRRRFARGRTATAG